MSSLSHRRKRNLQTKRAREEEAKRKLAKIAALEGIPDDVIRETILKSNLKDLGRSVNAFGQSIDYTETVRVKDSEFHLFLPHHANATPVDALGLTVKLACQLLHENPYVSLSKPRYLVIGAPVLGNHQSGMILDVDNGAVRRLLLEKGSPKIAPRLETTHQWAKDVPWILISYGVFSEYLLIGERRYALFDLADTICHEAFHVDGVPHDPAFVKLLNDVCVWNAAKIESEMSGDIDADHDSFGRRVEEHLKLQARFINEEANEAFRSGQERFLGELWDHA